MIVDVIYLYLAAVRSSGMYLIPLGSTILTNMQLHTAEFTRIMDLFELNQQPLICVSY